MDCYSNEAVTVTYTFLCNGKEVGTIKEDFVGLKGTQVIGSYPAKEIKTDNMQKGDNNLTIQISVATKEQGNKLENSFCSFNLEISDITVKITALDKDNDGIKDIEDPLISVNNYLILPIAALISMPAALIVVRVIPKRAHR